MKIPPDTKLILQFERSVIKLSRSALVARVSASMDYTLSRRGFLAVEQLAICCHDLRRARIAALAVYDAMITPEADPTVGLTLASTLLSSCQVKATEAHNLLRDDEYSIDLLLTEFDRVDAALQKIIINNWITK